MKPGWKTGEGLRGQNGPSHKMKLPTKGKIPKNWIAMTYATFDRRSWLSKHSVPPMTEEDTIWVSQQDCDVGHAFDKMDRAENDRIQKVVRRLFTTHLDSSPRRYLMALSWQSGATARPWLTGSTATKSKKRHFMRYISSVSCLARGHWTKCVW